MHGVFCPSAAVLKNLACKRTGPNALARTHWPERIGPNALAERSA